jgi:Trk K+ transport system NAD-binding subunit
MATESWLRRQLRTGRPTLQRVIPQRSPGASGIAPAAVPTAGADTGRTLHAPPRRLIVCGDDPLAYRLVDELVTRYGVEVTAILPNRRRNHGPQIAALLKEHQGRLVESDRLDSDAFRQAGAESADALALVKQDDVGNIHAALQAQELNPDIRLVIRMFNTRLGYGIRRLFADCRVLSDAQMAAPAFVSAALGEVAPVHVRVARRTLFVARRGDVKPEDIVCGLAPQSPQKRADLLPDDPNQADLVLAVARGRAAAANAKPAADVADDPDSPQLVLVRRGRRRPKVGQVRQWVLARRRHPLGRLGALVSPKLRIAAVVLVALLIAGTGVLAGVKHLSWWNAAYLTILTTLGGANPDLGAGAVEKITETMLTVVSIALIPVITAAVVEAVVNARLALALGRLQEPISDHVVLVGLGNVGTRIMHDLADLGVPCVVIDKSEAAKGAQAARTRDVPFIVGDASQVETLRAASVSTARALVVVSTDDVTNLEAALQARALKSDLRVVLRLFDGDFADRVQRAFGITSSRSVSYLAAPAFAAALLERQVIGTIPVNRYVLLLAETPVAAGSELDGAALAAAQEGGEVRVVAVVTDEGRETVWSPAGSHVLRGDDLLVVVATRLGLGRLLTKTGKAAGSRDAGSGPES